MENQKQKNTTTKPLNQNNMITIQDVKIGQEIISPRNGKGIITSKTKRTITVVFENGNTSKVTYKYNDADFYASDF